MSFDGRQRCPNRGARERLARDSLDQRSEQRGSAELVGFFEIEGAQSDRGSQDRFDFDPRRTVVEDERKRAEAIPPADVLTRAGIVGWSIERFDAPEIPADDLLRD